MTIIPVLDLLGGVVVRGVGGQRSEYRPVESRLTPSHLPLDVACAIRQVFGLSTLYVADLDAILHERPAWDTYRRLAQSGFTLWIDAGLRSIAATERLLAGGAAAAIVGLETWPDPETLVELCRRIGPEQIIFSLDLRQGTPLGNSSAWRTTEPLEIARRAVASGVQRMIVLDLARVGLGGGPGTLDLCRQLRVAFPGLQLITGGGVRNLADLLLLGRESIDGVLLASALHDGSLSCDLAEGGEGIAASEWHPFRSSSVLSV